MHLVSFERIGGAGRRHRTAAATLPSDRPVGGEPLEDSRPGAQRVGALIQLGAHAGSVVDLNRALAIKLAYEDVGAPEAEADSLIPPHMVSFLALGARAHDAAIEAFAFVTDALARYDAPDVVKARAVEHARDVRLCAPVPRPPKLVGVAGNHAGTNGRCEPVLFLKAASAVIATEDEIRLPVGCSQVDVAGGLAAIIGARAHRVSEAEALDFVVGYCPFNDVTAHDLAGVSAGGFIGKSCNTFSPLGPAIVTRDEIPDPQELALRTVISGEPAQLVSTKEMQLSVAAVIALASSILVLEPGDVILTGAHPGTGASRTPRWLRDGDHVEVEVERVGRLRNPVTAARPR